MMQKLEVALIDGNTEVDIDVVNYSHGLTKCSSLRRSQALHGSTSDFRALFTPSPPSVKERSMVLDEPSTRGPSSASTSWVGCQSIPQWLHVSSRFGVVWGDTRGARVPSDPARRMKIPTPPKKFPHYRPVQWRRAMSPNANSQDCYWLPRPTRPSLRVVGRSPSYRIQVGQRVYAVCYGQLRSLTMPWTRRRQKMSQTWTVEHVLFKKPTKQLR